MKNISCLLRRLKARRLVRKNFPKEQRLDLKSKEYFLPGRLVPVRENGKGLVHTVHSGRAAHPAGAIPAGERRGHRDRGPINDARR